MKTITIANNKGGVGKTTVAAHVGFRAGEQGQRVLLVDTDGQRNLTSTFVDIMKVIEHPGTFSLFYPNEYPLEPALKVTENISVLPATANKMQMIDRDDVEVLWAFRESLAQYANDYDLCVIDTPPSYSNRIVAALAASDTIFAPIKPEPYSLQGVGDLLRNIRNVKSRMNSELEFGGMIINLVNSQSKAHRETIAALIQRLGDKVIHPHLVDRVSVCDALKNGMPVWKYHSGESATNAGREFKLISDQVLETVGVLGAAA